MNALLAIRIVEGEAESDEQALDAWQYLVNTGIAFQLQGSYGRTAARLIEDGLINAPEVTA